MAEATMAIGAGTGSARIASARKGGGRAIAISRTALFAPHDDHRTRASNSDVAVAWLAVVPLGAALLLSLAG
jgi:hypothetical protein